jgi:hypothetical protein
MNSLVRRECSGGVVWLDCAHVVRIDSWRGRLLAARRRVPSTQSLFVRYVRHDAWHVCPYAQDLPFGSDQWIEVVW